MDTYHFYVAKGFTLHWVDHTKMITAFDLHIVQVYGSMHNSLKKQKLILSVFLLAISHIFFENTKQKYVFLPLQAELKRSLQTT